jgi:hypothetical protein
MKYGGITLTLELNESGYLHAPTTLTPGKQTTCNQQIRDCVAPPTASVDDVEKKRLALAENRKPALRPVVRRCTV